MAQFTNVEMESQCDTGSSVPKSRSEKGVDEKKNLLCWLGKTRRERYLGLALGTVAFVAFVLALTLVASTSLTSSETGVVGGPKAEALVSTPSKNETILEEINPSQPSTPIGELLPTAVESPVDGAPRSSDVCLTKGCVKAAAAVIERLNDAADPCQDFFDFACGNFVKNTIIPDEKSSVTMFSQVQDELREKLRLLLEEEVKDTDPPATLMAKNLYSSCMDKESIQANGLEPLHKILKEYGGWPVVEGDTWNAANFSWIDMNYINRRIGYSIDYLFDFSVTTDIRNSTWRMIWLDQPTMGMSREYLMKGLNDSDVQAYLKYSVDVAVLLGADPVKAQKDMEDVLHFQISIANISLPREERRNMTRLYNIRTLGEMSELAPDIPWVTYINNVLPTNLTVDETERIGVSDPNFFRNLTSLLNKTPNRVVANYLMWRIVSASASYLSEDIRDLQLEYSKKLTGKATRPPRWKECMGIISGKLSYAIGNLYAKNFFNEQAKAQAEQLVSYVRAEFNRILNVIDWMDETTRQEALLKSDAIRPHIAYPKELLEDEKLTEHYSELVIDTKSLLDNMRRVGIFGTNYSFGKLREMVDKLDWKRQAAVAVVNAYYSSIENSIKFPAGILQGVFFEPDRPKYMNFGGIGFVIGHEITHGFDDQGKQFDSIGNLKNWWEKETESKFLNKAKCIIHQYGNYTAPENGMQLNGINTQGENIADNGGIKEAYNAYQKWVADNGQELRLPGLEYTPNQLFWISAGQVWCSKYRPQSLKVRILTGVHSPGRFRVVGSFSNSEEFSKDWQCSVGSEMNPSQKCSVWYSKSTADPTIEIETPEKEKIYLDAENSDERNRKKGKEEKEGSKKSEEEEEEEEEDDDDDKFKKRHSYVLN